ncbi:hypothetical protein R3X25_14680 [Lutibacter sp. TH_r2]|uniref:hypothetical protein n=1 Tax=Lutibacter sp. TH_r2 TaxID=3082083 RepID=UPI002952C2E6|nr:hypothetical protein [Lutibacter sp. TH_r2]MDV7188533.1 hypothetical protein [Lutibacter sp. TH_r2]
MKKHILVLVLLFNVVLLYGQLNDTTVMGIPIGSTSEINGVTPLEEGAIVYNSDTKELMIFNGTTWVNVSSSTVYVGAFQITGTGNKVVTGLPFQPSQITFVAHANIEDFTGIDSDNGIKDNDSSIANSFGTMNGFARDDGGATPAQQVIYVGGSGNSINDISRYASNTNCIGLRYSNQNGNALGRTIGSLSSFNTNGFTINITNYAENVIVLFTAYK